VKRRSVNEINVLEFWCGLLPEEKKSFYAALRCHLTPGAGGCCYNRYGVAHPLRDTITPEFAGWVSLSMADKAILCLKRHEEIYHARSIVEKYEKWRASL